MILGVLIVDDEPLARALVRARLAAIPDVSVLSEAGDASGAFEAAERTRADVVILDIDMPGGGLNAARRIHQQLGAEIVFLTAHQAFAVEAFALDAADYLLKPVRPDRLVTALERVRMRRRRGAVVASGSDRPDVHGFWAPGRDGLTRIALPEIRWVEAARDYVYLHTANKAHMVRSTMQTVERRLTDPDLMRVHRSAIVRLSAIRQLVRDGKGWAVRLDPDGAVVRVGRDRLDALKIRLSS